MPLIISSYLKNMPSAWARYDSQVPGPPPRAFGFIDDAGEVNRFAARFRLAKSFSDLTFNHYTAETTAGYEGLVRLFFVWSAFEQFMKITMNNQKNIESILDRYNAKKLIKRIRRNDKDNRYFSFISSRTNNTHKKQLKNYFNEDECNITYLASAIRHVFVHGPLTPNADQTSPEKVLIICNYLSSFLISVMDNEFTRHIDEFDEMMKNYGSCDIRVRS